MSVPIRTSDAPLDPIGRARKRARIVRAFVYTILLLILVCGIAWCVWFVMHRASAQAPAVQRTAVGIWCFENDCQYFDANGVRWGTAPHSRGPIFLLVQDERTDAPVSEQFAQSILEIVNTLPSLGMRALWVTLPNAAPGDVRISTDKHYDLIIDGYSNVSDQLDTLSVFLADKAKDASFAPQYIDLRTLGRVYFK
jgi:hypothetical protein